MYIYIYIHNTHTQSTIFTHGKKQLKMAHFRSKYVRHVTTMLGRFRNIINGFGRFRIIYITYKNPIRTSQRTQTKTFSKTSRFCTGKQPLFYATVIETRKYNLWAKYCCLIFATGGKYSYH